MGTMVCKVLARWVRARVLLKLEQRVCLVLQPRGVGVRRCADATEGPTTGQGPLQSLRCCWSIVGEPQAALSYPETSPAGRPAHRVPPERDSARKRQRLPGAGSF